jgi:chemotaxis receptor (MCP) glutamine deamidase CheD
MTQVLREIVVQPDAFRVARESLLLVCELRAAMAICLHDDTQGAGGLLHLRYVATNDDQPLDLTDNTLSSDLLLMDRFCKELRSAGARKHSWKVTVIGHGCSDAPGMDAPAATVLDLVKAYFADSRLPIACKEIRAGAAGLMVRCNPREGGIWVSGASGAAVVPSMVAPARA